MVLKNVSKFVLIHLTKWRQGEIYMRGNNHFLKTTYLAHTHTKRTQGRNRYLKKRTFQNKRLTTNQLKLLCFFSTKNHPNAKCD